MIKPSVNFSEKQLKFFIKINFIKEKDNHKLSLTMSLGHRDAVVNQNDFGPVLEIGEIFFVWLYKIRDAHNPNIPQKSGRQHTTVKFN